MFTKCYAGFQFTTRVANMASQNSAYKDLQLFKYEVKITSEHLQWTILECDAPIYIEQITYYLTSYYST